MKKIAKKNNAVNPAPARIEINSLLVSSMLYFSNKFNNNYILNAIDAPLDDIYVVSGKVVRPPSKT